MTFDLAEARQILRGRRPRCARRSMVSRTWLDADEGEGTWTPWQALAHMTHVEEHDWVGRIETILEHGTDEVLATVDREAGFERYAGWPVGRVLERFVEIRSTNLDRLDTLAITDDDLRREGRHTPTSGS